MGKERGEYDWLHIHMYENNIMKPTKNCYIGLGKRERDQKRLK
jgi:hypothetical protein